MIAFRSLAWSMALGVGLLVSLLASGASTAAETTLRVPGTVDGGQEVVVIVDGAPGDGTLEVRGPYRDDGYHQLLGTIPVRGAQAVVTAPHVPGSYEFRFLDGTGRTLARAVVDVATTPVSLSVPDPLGAGYDGRVLWRGPGGPGDMIQVYDPVSRHVLSDAPAIGSPGSLNTTYVRMPEARGDFEVRYWHGGARVALRGLPITIGDGIGWLRSPIEVRAGKRFAVQWNGPSDPGMEYQIFDPGSGAVVASIAATPSPEGAEAASFKAPALPGQYRVRLVNPATGFIVADLPLDVDP